MFFSTYKGYGNHINKKKVEPYKSKIFICKTVANDFQLTNP